MSETNFMSRPCKKRFITKEPSKKGFYPCEDCCCESVNLKVDEFECIRLIDLESKTQEEVSKIFNVARTTVQAIYDEARKKIADALINSKRLYVTGGDYILKTESSFVKKEKAYKSILKEKEKNIMRIAIPTLNNEVFQHFGKTESFTIYDVDEKVNDKRVVLTNGEGHGALAAFLQAQNVDLLICGGIGNGAINKLSEAKIEVLFGASGNTDEVIDLYLKGKLESKGEPSCGCHHEHHEGEECHHHEGNHEHCCHHDK